MPYDWNPTRERGYGVYDFFATDQGLWVGSDTDTIGNEYHPRIAFFPLAGGRGDPVEGGRLASLVTSSRSSPGASPTDTVNRPDSGSVTAGTTTSVTGSDTWSHARGAMLVGSTLYTAWYDRMLYARPVNGATVGARSQVNLNAGPLCTNSSGSCAGAFSLDAPTITGMFYDSGRMYYTLSGVSSLYYRYFEPTTGYVGGTRFSATGSVSTLNPTRVRGMFLDGGRLYFADSTSGHLLSIDFDGGVVSGSVSDVNSSRTRAPVAWHCAARRRRTRTRTRSSPPRAPSWPAS